MKSQRYFDQEAFANDILELLKTRSSNELEDHDDDFDTVFAGNYEGNTEELETREKAVGLLKEQDLKKLICPFLKSCANDVFDIAKMLTPLISAATLSGKISFPLDAEISAAFFILIAKGGVASYCNGL